MSVKVKTVLMNLFIIGSAVIALTSGFRLV